ncbi:MAG: ABC transporter permease [Spirochaetales bacterium]|nr:ABC transporter permease [Spirochaetales bacterium]
MVSVLKKREFSLFIFIVFTVFIISLRSPRFFQLSNLYDILNDTSILIMVAMGQFIVIASGNGGIDLSVASGMALAGMSVAMLNQYYNNIPIFIIVLIALAIGFILGAFNGILVSFAGIPPIITTLGTMSIYRGFVFVLSGGEWVSADEMTAAFRKLPRGTFFGMTNIIFFALVITVIFYIFMKYTKTGREIYGIGGNRTAAQYVGINIKKISFLVYSVSGIIVGLGGLLWVSRYASAQNDTAMGFELQTIAACVIGGVGIWGGSGTVVGVLFGAVFLGIINNALPIINLSPFYQMAIQGFVILAAIIVNTVVGKRTQMSLLKKA